MFLGSTSDANEMEGNFFLELKWIFWNAHYSLFFCTQQQKQPAPFECMFEGKQRRDLITRKKGDESKEPLLTKLPTSSFQDDVPKIQIKKLNIIRTQQTSWLCEWDKVKKICLFFHVALACRICGWLAWNKKGWMNWVIYFIVHII